MNPSTEKLVQLWASVQRVISDSGEESKTEAEHEYHIRGQYNQLLNNLTSVSEITAYMFQDGKLTAKELEHIQQFQSTPIRASEELLNIITKSSPDVYECFLQSLKETKQDHVYQMLTITVEQNDYSGQESMSEHSRLIQRNYAWLTEKLNPDHSLLAVLLEKGVLRGRDYEQISSREETFKKNEMLLSLISRKSSVDFKYFQHALKETLQSHINQKLTEAAPGAQSTVPSRLPVAENHHTPTQHNVNMRQLFNVESQFKRLQNEVQFEVSTKIAILRKKGTNDNIWKILVEKILHESRQNGESQSRYKANEEALSTKLALNKRCLKELEGETSFYKQKLKEAESRLRETEKKLEERETSFKLSLAETEEKLKAIETKLEETEARLTVAQIPLDEIEAVITAEERKTWREEVQSLTNQIQEQSRIIVELQDKLKSFPLLAHEAKPIVAINTSNLIRGLAILEEEMFVLSEKSSEVKVYDSMKFSFSRRWNLKELIRPLDIGSCNRNKCLYILHAINGHHTSEILRVAPNGKLKNKWTTRNISGESLSVTDESNVILTVLDKNKLNEYSPDGKLIREINLSSDTGISRPYLAIKMSNGHYVVSHFGKANEQNLVCVVDSNGKLKKSAGGSTFGETIYPVYLAVDRNGFVMAIDQKNRQVMLLDSNLEFKREILSNEKHGLRGPFRILVDESNYQLIVADNQLDKGRILVFEFR